MAKDKRIIWIVGIIIVIILFGMQTKKEAQADVSSAVITRSLSATTVKAGASFTVDYLASGYGGGTWGVLLSDTISNGCTISGGGATINTGFISTQSPGGINVNAPASAATCQFNGDYEFGGSSLKTIQGSTDVTICEDECTGGQTGCVNVNTRWSCNTGAVCGVKVNTACESYESCSAGVCEAQCSNLETGAVNSIIAWVSDPTSLKRTAAIDAIVLWAVNC